MVLSITELVCMLLIGESVWCFGIVILTGNLKGSLKKYPYTSLSTRNSTWTGMQWKPDSMVLPSYCLSATCYPAFSFFNLL